MDDTRYNELMSSFYLCIAKMIKFHPITVAGLFKDAYKENEWEILLASTDLLKRKIAKIVLKYVYINGSEK